MHNLTILRPYFDLKQSKSKHHFTHKKVCSNFASNFFFRIDTLEDFIQDLDSLIMETHPSLMTRQTERKSLKQLPKGKLKFIFIVLP